MTSVQEQSVPFGFTTHHKIKCSIQLCKLNYVYVIVSVIQTTKKSCLKLLTPDA